MGSEERLAAALGRVNRCFSDQKAATNADEAIEDLLSVFMDVQAVPASLQSACEDLCGHLAEAAAAAKQGRWSPGNFSHARITNLLVGVLALLSSKKLVLSEADILRAMAAVDFPMQFLPHEAGALLENMMLTNMIPAAVPLPTLMADLTVAASTLPMLWKAVHAEDGVLPARVVQLLRANQLKPENMLSWLETISTAAVRACRQTRRLAFADPQINVWTCPPVLPSFWCDLLADPASFLANAVKERLPLQKALLSAATSFVIRHSKPGYFADDEVVAGLCAALRLASASCLADARRAMPSESKTLMDRVLALASSPALLQCTSQSQMLGRILIASLQLGAVLARDVQPSDPQLFVQRLDSLLPRLYVLAAQVAAAAPVHSQVAAATEAAGSSSAVTAAANSASGSAPEGSFAQLCWGPLAGEWSSMLAHWACLDASVASPLEGREVSSFLCLATHAIVQLLLRLVPLLPLQPAVSTNGSGTSEPGASCVLAVVTAAEAVAAAGGAAAVRDALQHGGQDMAGYAAVVLADRLPLLAGFLMQRAHVERFPPSDQEILVTLQTVSTACQYAHAVHGMLAGQPGAAGAGAGATLSSLVADTWDMILQAVILMDMALGSWYQFEGWHNSQQDALTPELRRRAECVTLLYLSTLPALPVDHLPLIILASNEGVLGARCTSLLQQMNVEGLHSFWQQLLQEPAQGSNCSSALELMLGTVLHCFQVTQHGRSARSWDSTKGFEDALGLLSKMIQTVPGASARVLRHRQLLETLQGVASWLLAYWRSASERTDGMAQFSDIAAAMLMGMLVDVFQGMAGHVPDSEAAVLAQLPSKPSSAAEMQVVRNMLHVFLEAAIARLDAGDNGTPRQEAQQQQQEKQRGMKQPRGKKQEQQRGQRQEKRQEQQPSNSDSQQGQFVVRCYQALALRNCADMRCPNLAGNAKGGPVKGLLCSGCQVVRYCGPACSQADWRQHRAACRLLRQPAD